MNPGVALVGAFNPAAFLHDEPIAGPRPRQFVMQKIFSGLAIRGRDVIPRSLHRDLQIFHLAEVPRQTTPRFEGCLGHDVHKRRSDHAICLPHPLAAYK